MASGQPANLQEWTDNTPTTLLAVDKDGKLLFGADANLYRSNTNELTTDDALIVAGALTPSAEFNLRRTEQNGEPTLTDDETRLWWDSDDSKMWLVTRRSGTQYKMEMT